MKAFLFSVMVAAVLMAASEARATFETRHIVEVCASDDPEFRGICTGYLWATVDAQEFYTRTQNAPKVFCMREGIDTEQLRKVYLAWAHGRPDALDLFAAVTIPMALRDAFPC